MVTPRKSTTTEVVETILGGNGASLSGVAPFDSVGSTGEEWKEEV
jgi:hypothetical protein